MHNLCKTAITLLSALVLAENSYKPGAYFEHKTVIIPKDETKFRGGEDAADSCDTALVVSDGVGGWAQQGVNPAFFSSKLTRSAIDKHLEDPNATAKEILAAGCEIATKEFQGSATVVSMKIDSANQISTANLGDCGYTLYHLVEGDRLEAYFVSETM